MFPDAAYYVWLNPRQVASGYARAGDVYQDYGGRPVRPLPDYGYSSSAPSARRRALGPAGHAEDTTATADRHLRPAVMNDNIDEIKGTLPDWTPWSTPDLGEVEVGGGTQLEPEPSCRQLAGEGR